MRGLEATELSQNRFAWEDRRRLLLYFSQLGGSVGGCLSTFLTWEDQKAAASLLLSLGRISRRLLLYFSLQEPGAQHS